MNVATVAQTVDPVRIRSRRRIGGKRPTLEGRGDFEMRPRSPRAWLHQVARPLSERGATRSNVATVAQTADPVRIRSRRRIGGKRPTLEGRGDFEMRPRSPRAWLHQGAATFGARRCPEQCSHRRADGGRFAGFARRRNQTISRARRAQSLAAGARPSSATVFWRHLRGRERPSRSVLRPQRQSPTPATFRPTSRWPVTLLLLRPSGELGRTAAECRA